ncbi:MAG: ABC transporter ATP-binding protein [Archaeoglobaceae archaeon]
MIELRKVTKIYKNRVAIKDINLEVGEEKIALIGPNGSGKSTLLKLISGILKPNSGKVVVLGNDPFKNSEVRRKIGIVTHNPMLYREFTVEENLKFFARIYGCELDKSILNLLDLNSKKSLKVSELSMGWIRRVAMARALIHKPEILMIDEGLSGLDFEARIKIFELIKRESDCLIYVTHDFKELEVFERYVVLRDGRLVYDGEEIEKAINAAGSC